LAADEAELLNATNKPTKSRTRHIAGSFLRITAVSRATTICAKDRPDKKSRPPKGRRLFNESN
jgi:hypothetical protein